MPRLRTLLLLLLLAAVLPSCGRTGRPNFVLVVGGPVGWMDYGFMASRVARTPSLDALAREGTVFTHAYAAASYAPRSLAPMLVGMEPFALYLRQRRLGAAVVPREPVGKRYDTLPRLLAARGYASFASGPVGEGDFAESGFDGGSAGGALAPVLSFIDAHAGGPFFVWYAPPLPHPPYRAAQSPAAAKAPVPDLAAYHEAVTRLDADVGQIVARLAQHGLSRRTLVVFVSSSGWDAVTTKDPAERALVGGDRGEHTIYDVGFRTPLVATWPGELPAGVRVDSLVSDIDVFATVLDFAGVPLPARATSRSLRPLLEGKGGTGRARILGDTPEYRDPDWHVGDKLRKELVPARAWFLRTPDWRYVWYARGDRSELYRIEEDPTEEHDVAAGHPDLVARFRDELAGGIADMDRAADRDRELTAEIDAWKAHRAEARRRRARR